MEKILWQNYACLLKINSIQRVLGCGTFYHYHSITSSAFIATASTSLLTNMWDSGFQNQSHEYNFHLTLKWGSFATVSEDGTLDGRVTMKSRRMIKYVFVCDATFHYEYVNYRKFPPSLSFKLNCKYPASVLSGARTHVSPAISAATFLPLPHLYLSQAGSSQS